MRPKAKANYLANEVSYVILSLSVRRPSPPTLLWPGLPDITGQLQGAERRLVFYLQRGPIL